MPLIMSKNKKTMGKNIETEMHHGKPQDQAVAIAYHVMRKAKAKKMAMGGMSPEQQQIDGNSELKPFDEPEHFETYGEDTGFQDKNISGEDEEYDIEPHKFAMGGSAPIHPLDMMFRKKFLEAKKMACGGMASGGVMGNEDMAAQDYDEYEEPNRTIGRRMASQEGYSNHEEVEDKPNEDEDRLAFARSMLMRRGMRK